MLAGATAVQVGTANYWDPRATEKIATELRDWCEHHQVSRLAELTGAMTL
jgi:dihydroorotate dehydrogenase (NAD+) catalytic subunit